MKFFFSTVKICCQDWHRLLGRLRDRRQQHLGQERICEQGHQQGEEISSGNHRALQGSKQTSISYYLSLKRAIFEYEPIDF